MKKIFLFMPFIAFALSTACSEDKDDSRKAEEITLKVGEHYTIPGNVSQIEAAPDPFVADIEGNRITGNHAGMTAATVQAGSTIYDYRITVDANYTLYVDMAIFFGISRSNIEKLYGNPLSSKDDTCNYKGIGFELGNIFTYTDNKVSSALIIFPPSYASMIGKHLADRYLYVGKQDDVLLSMNSNDAATGTVGVGVIVSASQIGILYFPLTKEESAVQAGAKALEAMKMAS